ncbi:MAG TPA: sulfotransferase [Rhizomicrobium sp.]|nr:sulfotransferase [Rhizomicrobium sp.]
MSEEISEAKPIVVAGTGGSGTRAIVRFLSKCDVDMGETKAGRDAVAFVDLLDRHINSVLELTRSCDYDPSVLPAPLRDEIVADYRKAANEHRSNEEGSQAWGFKNPRHMFLLPLLSLALPKAKFVHLVRDGRDMLLSENVRQPNMHFQALFGRPFANSHDDIARFWSRTNTATKQFGLRAMGEQYISVRIEDLWGPERRKHVQALATALDLDREAAIRREDVFEEREGYGRGRAAEFALSAETRAEFEAALSEFGYIP